MPRRKTKDEYVKSDDPDRLEGVEAIMAFIDPNMSKRLFYRKWRPLLASVMFEYERPYLRPGRYFTFKPLVIGVMLNEKRI